MPKPKKETTDGKPERSSVLLKVAPDWKPPEGLEVQHKYGQFVRGLASLEALKSFDLDPDVLSHELDLGNGRFY